ncbi:hypothetical protein [Pseudomonas sp. GZD-222]|uniref:hypothetical protein n=1 Tax=Pseudomonas sp. GZD-222 TaxID=3404805 RepID=UPI003BB7DB66
MARMAKGMKTWLESKSAIIRLAQRYEGLTGVDYGYIYKNGFPLKTLGVRFHVRTKQPLSEVSETQLLPTSLYGLKCDVVQASYSICGSPQQPCDPVQPGVSIGNYSRGSTGTLGLLVRDKLTKRPAILSNWHVLYGNMAAGSLDEIIQPGPFHMGSSSPRIVGHPERCLPLSTGIDAAIALLNPETNWDPEIFSGLVKVTGVALPKIGMELEKYGAMTEFTHGVVDGAEGPFSINYSYADDAWRSMDAIRIRVNKKYPEEEISLEGDSGAVWFDAEGRAVALLFAGEDGLGATAEYALAHPIAKVFNLLKVEPI